jgi:hypothetical protein
MRRIRAGRPFRRRSGLADPDAILRRRQRAVRRFARRQR